MTLYRPASQPLFSLSHFWICAGGLRAVAQIEDGAVGLGMTTFVSKVQSITERQKVTYHACHAHIVCSNMRAGHPT